MSSISSNFFIRLNLYPPLPSLPSLTLKVFPDTTASDLVASLSELNLPDLKCESGEVVVVCSTEMKGNEHLVNGEDCPVDGEGVSGADGNRRQAAPSTSYDAIASKSTAFCYNYVCTLKGMDNVMERAKMLQQIVKERKRRADAAGSGERDAGANGTAKGGATVAEEYSGDAIYPPDHVKVRWFYKWGGERIKLDGYCSGEDSSRDSTNGKRNRLRDDAGADDGDDLAAASFLSSRIKSGYLLYQSQSDHNVWTLKSCSLTEDALWLSPVCGSESGVIRIELVRAKVGHGSTESGKLSGMEIATPRLCHCFEAGDAKERDEWVKEVECRAEIETDNSFIELAELIVEEEEMARNQR